MTYTKTRIIESTGELEIRFTHTKYFIIVTVNSYMLDYRLGPYRSSVNADRMQIHTWSKIVWMYSQPVLG